MVWRFRKSIKIGPVRINLSKSGIGTSIGVRGLRVGKDAKGRSYTAASIPGKGIFQRKYSSQDKTASSDAATVLGAGARQSSGVGCLVLLLVLLAGGLAVSLLMLKAAAPSVTPPTVVSEPPAPLQPVPVKRRRDHRLAAAPKSATVLQ